MHLLPASLNWITVSEEIINNPSQLIMSVLFMIQQIPDIFSLRSVFSRYLFSHSVYREHSILLTALSFLLFHVLPEYRGIGLRHNIKNVTTL